MPTYEYLCQTCTHRFETWQKMIDEPLTVCPECGGHIRRVFYPAGIVFKGSGFYKTDHNGSAAVKAGANGSDSATKNESASTSETSEAKTSSESKPTEGNSSEHKTPTSAGKAS